VNIVIEYDSSAANAPAGFKTAVQAAVNFMDYFITNPITVPIVFSYGEIQGSTLSSNAIGESSTNGNIETFASLVSYLKAAATSSTDAQSIAALPTTDFTNGGRFWVSDAQAQVFGLGAEPGYTDPEDGFVGVSSKLPLTWDPANRAVAGDYDAVGVIEHEITEVMGRYGYLGQGGTYNGYNLYGPMDLFRYSGPGQHSYAYSGGYFSVDGQHMLLPFNNPSNGGDAADWDASVVGDSFGDGYSGTAGYVSQTDAQVMDVIGYSVAPIGNPVAGAAPVTTATNGATASFAATRLASLITNDYLGELSITSATLDPSSTGDGTVSFNAATDTASFTPAAGFAGTTVIDLNVSDGIGGSVVQAWDVNVVVQASAPVVVAPNTTTTSVNGNVTTLTTYSPTGALISTEVTSVTANETVSTFSDATGTRYAATITQTLGGGETEVQNFNGTWQQQTASLTWNQGGGNSEVQNFDGSWNMTSAVVTTVSGATTIVQNFDSHWNQTSATYTIINGDVTETQHFDAHWTQTSANLTIALANGAVESQDFNANWQQTDATLTTHPSANVTEIQTFDANWVQTGASEITVNGTQTTTQTFDANWNMTGATISNALNSSTITTKLDTYGPTWNPLTEVDTAPNGGQSFFVYGQAGGGQSFTAATSHSTTFVFDPGQITGDTISGLHSLNLGGSIHDVIDFEGYGAGAHLTQIDATHWQIVSTGHASETFTLTGGATLGTGDYFFHG
jgi:hypothetical protein